MFGFSVPRALIAALLALNICIGLLGVPAFLHSAGHAMPTHVADDVPPLPTPH
jgi:hypothetical protein